VPGAKLGALRYGKSFILERMRLKTRELSPPQNSQRIS